MPTIVTPAGTSVTTTELAKAVKWSIDYNITGIYHVTNNIPISKYELLRLFQKYCKKDINIKSFSGKNNDKSFIDTRCLMNYEIPLLMLPEAVEISTMLTEDERPREDQGISKNRTSLEYVPGPAFHEKSEKNSQVNRGGSYRREIAIKYKKPKTKGDKNYNKHNKKKKK